MRKVLSIVLVLALVLGSTAFSFGAVPSDVAGSKYEDAVNVLMELDVISGYPDGSYKPAGIVTRGEMAKIIICALGLEDYAAGASSFKDMAGHWSDKYVAYAVSLGIINGYPDGTFKADNTVTYQEAAKMLVAALGYTEDALTGSWPANWVVMAQAKGILDGITGGPEGAVRGDIALMTYQTMGQQIGTVDKDGLWTGLTKTVGGVATPDTMFLRLGATFNAAKVLLKADADTAKVDIRNLIGAYAEYYTNSDGEIIAVEVLSTFITGEVTMNVGNVLITDIETDDVEYSVKDSPSATDNRYDDGTAVRAAAEKFTNGLDGGAGYSVVSGDTVTVSAKVSGKTITDIYAIMDWNISQNKKVKAVDLKAITASTPKLLTAVFELDKNNEIDLNAFELVGVDKLEDIKEDHIVYVYANTVIAKIEVGTKVVEGEVTKITSGGAYTIDGKAYEFSTASGRKAPTATVPAVGKTVKLWLDASGDIYDYKATEGVADDYAIVLRTGVHSGTVGDLDFTDAQIELYLADGTKKLFDVDYDAFGTGITAAIYAVGGPTWNINAGDIIKYDVNSDGEVNAIEWILDAGTAAGAPTLAGAAGATGVSIGGGKVSKEGMFNGAKITDDVQIFTYDAQAGGVFGTKADHYAIGKRSAFLDKTLTAVSAVVVDGGVIELMYIPGDVVTGDKVFGVLIDTATIGTSDPKYEATMLVDGEEVVYQVKENITGYALGKKVYEVVFAADGVTVSDLKDIEVAAVRYKHTAVLTGATDVVDISGTVVDALTAAGLASTFTVTDASAATTTPAFITLADDAIVYVWNGSEYELGSTSDVDGETKANLVFFDVDGDGMAFDIVLVK